MEEKSFTHLSFDIYASKKQYQDTIDVDLCSFPKNILKLQHISKQCKFFKNVCV